MEDEIINNQTQAQCEGTPSETPKQEPVSAPVANPPARQLRTKRGLLKYILLSIITLGIYSIVLFSHMSEEINLVAQRRDGKHTMHYCLVFFIFSWLSLGIVPLVWMTKISNRIGNEQLARTQHRGVSGGTFWGWGILGSLIIVGPFIYYYKLFKSMNAVNAHYNING
ncbi:MAG: DUF4234 domain-containing protein [Bacteroidales bacterium]|nr:DUF4234 domain-containing protein [Candidatus Colimorpha pelethequi]MCQ2261606.1 DUF4234 domain-containing protein [Bacteroidales bacterium]